MAIFSYENFSFILSNLRIEHNSKKRKGSKLGGKKIMKTKNSPSLGGLKVSMMKKVFIIFTRCSQFGSKLYNSNHSNFEMALTKVKATHPWPLDFRFEAHSSMHSSEDWMFSIVFRLEIEPSPSVHPNPIKILPFGNRSEIIVEHNELGRGKYIYNLITKRGRGAHKTS